MDYLDFELEILPGSGREYPVTVLRSPAGEARAVMQFPFDKLALENHLLKLQNALLRSGGKWRSTPSLEEEAVCAFGAALFDALFSGDVRTRYAVSWERAEREGLGLRVKLRILDPGLAALPWEFLYDPQQGEYLCLSRNSPLVRYLELPQRVPSLQVTPPLHILGMIASPSDQVALDVEREKARVEKGLARLIERGQVELTWLAGQTWRDLQAALQEGPWHVFHFVGHGGYDPDRDEGLVVLAGEDGRSEYLGATQLARLLADQRSLRLVLLNACEGARGGEKDVFSSTAAVLVRRGIPAVLAMQYAITDDAAIETARAFYEALARGLPVDAAVSEARKAVSLAVPNSVEWGTPVLYMRTPDGVLFVMPPPGPAAPQLDDAQNKAQAPPRAGEAEVQQSDRGRVEEASPTLAHQDAPAQPTDAIELAPEVQAAWQDSMRGAAAVRPASGRGYGLWLQWVLTAVISWAVVAAVPPPSIKRSEQLEIALVGIAFIAFYGAVLGSLQWLVLRQRIPRSGWWAPATTSGVVMAVVMNGSICASVGPWRCEEPYWRMIEAVLLGTIIGAMQWLVLHPRLPRSGWWVLASFLGSFVGGFVSAGLSGSLQYRGTVAVSGPTWLAASALTAAVQGVALVLLLRRSRQVDLASNDHPA